MLEKDMSNFTLTTDDDNLVIRQEDNEVILSQSDVEFALDFLKISKGITPTTAPDHRLAGTGITKRS